MEFEEEVSKTLESYGYPILYRNLFVMLNRTQLTEFDIVSKEFIVEVKSGHYAELHGLNELYIRDLFPKGMILYVYCPKKTDSEIEEYNTNYDNSKIKYINTLYVILKHHKPGIECAIDTQAVFDNFLNLTMKSIKKFSKVYVQKTAFDKVFLTLRYYRESSSKKDNITWSEKIQYLIKENRLEVLEELPKDCLRLNKRGHILSKITVHQRKGVQIPLYYNLRSFEKTSDIAFEYYCPVESQKHRDYLGILNKFAH